MHTELTQHNPELTGSNAPVRVTVVMPLHLRTKLLQLADADRRSLSNQCVVLIERALADPAIAA